jgi:hypothetical protein
VLCFDDMVGFVMPFDAKAFVADMKRHERKRNAARCSRACTKANPRKMPTERAKTWSLQPPPVLQNLSWSPSGDGIHIIIIIIKVIGRASNIARRGLLLLR